MASSDSDTESDNDSENDIQEDEDKTWKYHFFKDPPNYQGLFSRTETIPNQPLIQKIVDDNYRFKKFNSFDAFYKYYLNLSKAQILEHYETIPGNIWQKPHFDIDIKISKYPDIAKKT